jgi:hypothetical protein
MAVNRANSPPCPRPAAPPYIRPHPEVPQRPLFRRNRVGVVVNLKGKDPSKGSIDRLIALTRDDMGKVNELILSKAGSHVELIPQIANHLISSGGKRLRPMLTLAAARMFGYGAKAM